MFRRSRRKIVAAIMSVLVMLFLGTLAVIYGFSYVEVSAANQEMLERYAKLYSLINQPGEDKRNGDTPAFRLSTFYSVAIADTGEVLAVDTGNKVVYDETVLKDYAFGIVKNGRDKGVKDNLIYLMMDKNGYTLVAFMDNTVMQESMTTLFRYTLVFGSLAILVLFFAAVYLAKRIVQPLEESYQKQKQFISDAGHELKTPVSVVSANAEMLAREIGENRWLTNIQHENVRMGELVTQLLELARTENVIPEMENINFSRILMGEVLPFETIAFEQGLMLQADVPDKMMVRGNASQLGQLTSILLDNAIRHSKPGGLVRVSVKKSKTAVHLSVVNEGDPIPEEQQKQLFERFYRADEARTGNENRYGLGLAIARAITEAHKGKIHMSCYDGLIDFKVDFPAN